MWFVFNWCIVYIYMFVFDYVIYIWFCFCVVVFYEYFIDVFFFCGFKCCFVFFIEEWEFLVFFDRVIVFDDDLVVDIVYVDCFCGVCEGGRYGDWMCCVIVV